MSSTVPFTDDNSLQNTRSDVPVIDLNSDQMRRHSTLQDNHPTIVPTTQKQYEQHTVPVIDVLNDRQNNQSSSSTDRNNIDYENDQLHNQATNNSQHQEHQDQYDITNEVTNDSSLSSIKPGLAVQYQDWDEYPIHDAVVISRAGKSSGKNKHFWNTTRPDGSNHVVDFSKVHRWKPNISDENNDNTQENITDSALLALNKSKEIDSKIIELEQWKTMGVYREV